MTLRSATVVALLAAVLLLPASASAATGTANSAASTAPPAPSYVTTTSGNTSLTVTYDLSWTLPTAGKSGCTVCHADPDLVRIQGGKTVSLYVDTAVLENSAHKDVPCTGCHVDFAYKTPHSNVTTSGVEWKAVAKASCKNCHVNEFAEYSSSAHSPSRLTGYNKNLVGRPDSSAPGKPMPLCGDCHGGHSIPASDNVEAMNAEHLSGIEMCGGCHAQDTGAYVDYYHGAAYKMAALDSPACWDCHNTHDVLPSTNRQSSVNKDRIQDTCHKCHSDPGDGYTSYTQLVHHKQDVLDANPLYAWLKSVKEHLDSFGQKIKSIIPSRSS
jgi:hypothetical protein